MIDRLEEYSAILNAPVSAYSRREAKAADKSHVQDQLFPTETDQILLVVGPPCAGKSTLGMSALKADSFPCQVVDASAIVRARRKELELEEREISDFARSLLHDDGPDIVARTIAQRYSRAIDHSSLIITGFRTIEEVQFFRRNYANVRVISIEAPSRVRYERYIKRGTRATITSYSEFRDHDEEQYAFGLLGVAPLLADLRVKNVYGRDLYYKQVARILGTDSEDAPGIIAVSSRMDPEVSQLYRCLVVLRNAGRPMTTQEIELDFGDTQHVRYNNANKMLKRYPQLARRQEGNESNVRYHITPAGLAFLAAVDWLQPNG
jgi:dephospho-CoA kinase